MALGKTVVRYNPVVFTFHVGLFQGAVVVECSDDLGNRHRQNTTVSGGSVADIQKRTILGLAVHID